MESLDNGRNVDAIYMDFQKVFNKLVHTCLLSKLRCYGLLHLSAHFAPATTHCICMHILCLSVHTAPVITHCTCHYTLHLSVHTAPVSTLHTAPAITHCICQHTLHLSVHTAPVITHHTCPQVICVPPFKTAFEDNIAVLTDETSQMTSQ